MKKLFSLITILAVLASGVFLIYRYISYKNALESVGSSLYGYGYWLHPDNVLLDGIEGSVTISGTVKSRSYAQTEEGTPSITLVSTKGETYTFILDVELLTEETVFLKSNLTLPGGVEITTVDEFFDQLYDEEVTSLTADITVDEQFNFSRIDSIFYL